ncbi:MAG: thiol peroxidase [Waddliaceae bacterium]
MLKITFKDEPIEIKGEIPEEGSIAPNFELTDQTLHDVSLESFGQKQKLLNVFVSLDTSVCAKSLHTFNQSAASDSNLVILNISMDLPFAASRFCKKEKLENVITLSAFRSRFPDEYGLKIMDGPIRGLLSRAVFVLGEDNTILYRELVPEITQEPNYAEALKALRKR